MKRSRDELSAEQVNAGRRMREEHGASWYRIGQTLGCDSKTIRRALDPLYDEHMRAARARRRKSLADKRGPVDVKARCAAFKAKPSHRRPQRKMSDYESTGEEDNARRRATKQDGRFADAMTAAIRASTETCPIGVDTRPGTHSPQLIEARSNLARTIFGSSSQMCADVA